jgi:hypothetical protein
LRRASGDLTRVKFLNMAHFGGARHRALGVVHRQIERRAPGID